MVVELSEGQEREAELLGAWAIRGAADRPGYAHLRDASGAQHLVPWAQLLVLAEAPPTPALWLQQPLLEQPADARAWLAEPVEVVGTWAAPEGPPAYMQIRTANNTTHRIPVAQVLTPAAETDATWLFAVEDRRGVWVGLVDRAERHLMATWVPSESRLYRVDVLPDARLSGVRELFMIHTTNSHCPSTSVCSLVARAEADAAVLVYSTTSSGEIGWFDNETLYVPSVRSGGRGLGWRSTEGTALSEHAPIMPNSSQLLVVVESGAPLDPEADEPVSEVVFRDVMVVPWLPTAEASR